MSVTEKHIEQILSGAKTVYFLGAGASNASRFELPTMDRFFSKEDLPLDDFPELHRFMKSHFRHTCAEAPGLEDVITYLELALDRFGSFGKHIDTYLYAAREEFNRYVMRRLAYSPVEGKYSCSRFEKLLRHLRPSDSLVTLNYDLIVESTLDENDFRLDKMAELLNPTIRATAPAGLHKWEFENGWYLKLHGSINWYYCSNPDCVGRQFITVLETHRRDIPPFCNSCGSAIEMVIVPPTMNKAFGKYPRLGAIWSIVQRELASSTCIVFIGVGFRLSDYYLSWLIKSSCVGKEHAERLVVLVDKDEELPDRVEELVGKRPVYCGSLKSYISALSKMGHAREYG